MRVELSTSRCHVKQKWLFTHACSLSSGMLLSKGHVSNDGSDGANYCESVAREPATLQRFLVCAAVSVSKGSRSASITADSGADGSDRAALRCVGRASRLKAWRSTFKEAEPPFNRRQLQKLFSEVKHTILGRFCQTSARPWTSRSRPMFLGCSHKGNQTG